MNKNWIIGICLLLVVMGITTAATIKIGSTERTISDELSAKITSDLIQKDVTLEEDVADIYIQLKEDELMDNLESEIRMKIEDVFSTRDAKLILALNTYLDKGCATPIK